MIDFVRDHPWGVVGIGVVVAAVIAGVLTALTPVPTPYAIVVALGVASPAMNLGKGGDSFDRDGYVTDGGFRGILVDGGLAGILGMIVGFLVVAVTATFGLTNRGVLTATAAGGTVLGASFAFVFRTMDYRSVPDGEATDVTDDPE